ncbi:hypothetical protein BDQ17DRAFT_131013 [Cyathus striatus]|nr:hypothetical protein BDQ17DRAFT_131013 [Cyathus striatus]
MIRVTFIYYHVTTHITARTRFTLSLTHHHHPQTFIVASLLPFINICSAITMDIDIDEFFSELDRRMSMPEEGSREYLQRLASYAKRSSISRFNGELGDVIEPAVGEGVNAKLHVQTTR